MPSPPISFPAGGAVNLPGPRAEGLKNSWSRNTIACQLLTEKERIFSHLSYVISGLSFLEPRALQVANTPSNRFPPRLQLPEVVP